MRTCQDRTMSRILGQPCLGLMRLCTMTRKLLLQMHLYLAQPQMPLAGFLRLRHPVQEKSLSKLFDCASADAQPLRQWFTNHHPAKCEKNYPRASIRKDNRPTVDHRPEKSKCADLQNKACPSANSTAPTLQETQGAASSLDLAATSREPSVMKQ